METKDEARHAARFLGSEQARRHNRRRSGRKSGLRWSCSAPPVSYAFGLKSAQEDAAMIHDLAPGTTRPGSSHTTSKRPGTAASCSTLRHGVQSSRACPPQQAVTKNRHRPENGTEWDPNGPRVASPRRWAPARFVRKIAPRRQLWHCHGQGWGRARISPSRLTGPVDAMSAAGPRARAAVRPARSPSGRCTRPGCGARRVLAP